MWDGMAMETYLFQFLFVFLLLREWEMGRFRGGLWEKADAKACFFFFFKNDLEDTLYSLHSTIHVLLAKHVGTSFLLPSSWLIILFPLSALSPIKYKKSSHCLFCLTVVFFLNEFKFGPVSLSAANSLYNQYCRQSLRHTEDNEVH